MQLDVMPDELGLLPNVGSAGAGGASNASALRFASSESRDPKGRKSTKPLLMTLCDIANYVLQDICGQQDMQFAFEGLQAEEDKQALVDRGRPGQVQNGMYSIDEVRGLAGPAPVGPAGDLRAGRVHGAGADPVLAWRRSSSREHAGTRRASRAGDELRAAHPVVAVADDPAERSGAGGTDEAQRHPSRPGRPAPGGPSPPATPPPPGRSSRRRRAPGGPPPARPSPGPGRRPSTSELGALKRHLRKGRLISTWVRRHIPERALGMIAEDVAKGVLLDVAVERAGDICLQGGRWTTGRTPGDSRRARPGLVPGTHDAFKSSSRHWPGWERDLGLVGAYKTPHRAGFP